MRARTDSAAARVVVLAHVEVAVAVEFDDAGEAGGEVSRELVVVDRLGPGDEELVPAGVGEALGEVALVVVDEELGVEIVDRRRRLAPNQERARLRPVDPAGRRPLALHGQPAVEEEGADERGADPGEAPGAGVGSAVGAEQLRGRRGGLRVGVERGDQRRRRPRAQLGVLVQQQAVVCPAPASAGSSRSPPCRCVCRARSGGSRRRGRAPPRPSRRPRRCRGRGSRARLRPGGCARSRRGRRAAARGLRCSRRSRRRSVPSGSR